MSLAENALLTAEKSRSLVRKGLIDFEAARKFAAECIYRYNVKCGGVKIE